MLACISPAPAISNTHGRSFFILFATFLEFKKQFYPRRP
jgi:hypothetical protein